MGILLYVDNSNVWIEAMYVAAVAAGDAPDIHTAHQFNIMRPYILDFGRLHEFAGGSTSEVTRAVLYGSQPPKSDSLWRAAREQGFEVVVYDRKSRNKEKKVDTKIVTDMITESFTLANEGDQFTLVAGDSDYIPVLEQIRVVVFPSTLSSGATPPWN